MTDSPLEENARPVRRALAGLSLSLLLASLGTSVANVALPTLVQVFAAPFQQVQWVVLAYLLATTTVIVGVGRLGDLIGRRRLLLTGLVVFMIGSLLCAAAPVLDVLIAARAVQGLGAATLMALTMAFVGDIVPKEKTGSAMGLLGTMSAVGTALGPSLGGLLIAAFGWQSLFLINLPLGLLAFALVRSSLPADRVAQPTTAVRFDLAGLLVLGATLGAYALAMTLGRGHFGAMNAGLLLAAVAGVALFMVVEQRAAAPLVKLSLFGTAGLGSGFALSLLVTTVVMSTLVVGPFYLAGALGLATASVGLAMSCGPVVAALAGVPAGRLVDRFGMRATGAAGLLAMLAGTVMLSLLPAALGVAGYLLPLSVVTAGYALFQAANNTAVMKEVRAEQRGVVAGLLNLSRNLGLVTGASVMGAIYAAGTGASDMATATAAQVSAGLHLTFAVAAALVLLALVSAGMEGMKAQRVAAREVNHERR